MPIEDVPPSLQESILAALIFDERHGAVIAGQVTARFFDEGYREIAERVLNYRRKFRRAPGRTHLDDLFGKLLQPGRAPRIRRMVFDLAELANGINGEYLVARTEEFVRQQRYKGALVEANSRFEQGGEGLANDIEGIFTSAIRARTATMEAGTFLNDTKRGFKFFERSGNGISFGIKALDDIGFFLAPKEQTLYIGPKGSGKTFACVQVGTSAILQNKRVVHLSLEMDEPPVIARYYQRAFAAALRPDKFVKSYLDFDRLERMTGWRSRTVAPNWSFADPGAQKLLRKKLRPWGARFGNLVVKHFPSGSLTIGLLEGYLDYLEIEEGFTPHVLIVDYPDLMKLDAKNLRIDTGRTFVELRGVADRRNLALFTPTQGGRNTIGARFTESKDVTEDISKVFTADQTMTYQQTKAEYEIGLARLSIEHARALRGGSMIVVTQSYSTGQYVLQSALMNQSYWEKLREVTGDRDE
jgi:ABC-type dipeptide/oligopeptide/nickel transport system ATPase component